MPFTLRTHAAPATLTRPQSRSASRHAVRVLGGSLFVALAAQAAVYLPGIPVAVTAQTLAVLLVGAALGARAGAASLALYWLEGLAGLPVFAGATGGPIVAFGPSGGYLLGFVLSAFLIGRAVESGWADTLVRRACAVLAATAASYLLGLAWLATFVGVRHAVDLGLAPFVLGELAKMVLAVALLPLARRCRRWL